MNARFHARRKKLWLRGQRPARKGLVFNECLFRGGLTVTSRVLAKDKIRFLNLLFLQEFNEIENVPQN